MANTFIKNKIRIETGMVMGTGGAIVPKKLFINDIEIKDISQRGFNIDLDCSGASCVTFTVYGEIEVVREVITDDATEDGWLIKKLK